MPSYRIAVDGGEVDSLVVGRDAPDQTALSAVRAGGAGPEQCGILCREGVDDSVFLSYDDMEAGTNVGAMPKSASGPGVPAKTAAFRGKAITPQAVVHESRGDTTRDHLMAPVSRTKAMTASWRTPFG